MDPKPTTYQANVREERIFPDPSPFANHQLIEPIQAPQAQADD